MSMILFRRPHPSVEPVGLGGGSGELELGKRGGQRGGIEARHPPEVVGSRGLLLECSQNHPRMLAELRRLTSRLLEPKRLEDVGDSSQRGRPEAEKGVRPGGERRCDLAGDCEDLSAGLQREVGGDQRAASLPASTMTEAAASPAMIRLRAGNRHGAGSTPGAYSETTSPCSQIPRARLACAAG